MASPSPLVSACRKLRSQTPWIWFPCRRKRLRRRTPFSTRPNAQDATKCAQPRTPAGRQRNHAHDERTTSNHAVRETDLANLLGAVSDHRGVGGCAAPGTLQLVNSAHSGSWRVVYRCQNDRPCDDKANPLLPCCISRSLRIAGTLQRSLGGWRISRIWNRQDFPSVPIAGSRESTWVLAQSPVDLAGGQGL